MQTGGLSARMGTDDAGDDERLGMADGQVLEFAGVTKRFGTVTAVSGLSARVEPGLVTGFLGPNGAGKTTTLRILLGLVRATSGTALIGGVPYARLRAPLQSVGAVLEASSFHPGRTAANHLTIYAQAAGLTRARVDEVLGTVGLAEVAGSKVGGFSLGMKQRLSLAYALLGDPGVLILDEPSNGLDPEGIIWMRSLLRELARQGRTVLVSSHLLAEVQQTVDALLIIAQGRLVFQGGLEELTDPEEFVTVVDSPDRADLSTALDSAGAQFELLRSGFTVRGSSAAEVGRIAASAGVGLSLLQRRGPGLEDVFLDLVNGARVHPSAAGDAGARAAPIGGRDSSSAEPVEGSPPPPADGDDGDSEPVPEPRVPTEAPPRPAFAVASTGVIDIVNADDAGSSGPEFFEPTESVTEPAPGAADDDADPATGDVIVPASEDPSTTAGDPESDLENEERPVTQRWEAQFDPVVDPTADDELSDSDAAADRFFADSDKRDEGAGR